MYFQHDGINFHYQITPAKDKDAPWLVLGHALACNMSMWDEQVAILSQKFNVLCLDSRGHGLTSELANFNCSLDDLATDVIALLDYLAIEQFHWLGLSMGGMLGQLLAIKYPRRVLSSVLCSTTCGPYPHDDIQRRIKWMNLAKEGGMPAIAELTLSRWFSVDFYQNAPTQVAKVASWVTTTSVNGYIACSSAIAAVNLLCELDQISCPILILIGNCDSQILQHDSKLMQNKIKNAKLGIIPNSGHLINIEQAELFMQQLQLFYAKL